MLLPWYSVNQVIFSLIVQVLFHWDIGDKWEKGRWGPEIMPNQINCMLNFDKGHEVDPWAQQASSA